MSFNGGKIYEFGPLFVEGLTQPFGYLLDPSKRIYWLYLLSSMVLTLFVVFCASGFRWRRLPSLFLSRTYWFNSSSYGDVFYIFLNSVIKILLLIPLFGSHLVATVWAARFFQSTFDNAPEWNAPLLVVIGLYTITLFLFEDLSRFTLHFALHKNRWLWKLHQVHHSAKVLTPLTVHRIHPLEMTLYFLRGLLVFGVVSGFFIYMFGAKVSAITVLGVDALGFAFNLAGANLRHSHVWLRFGWFERFFISPAQHQIHHSRKLAHKDKNFGTCLSVWDRVMGTCVYAEKRRRFLFGLS